MTIKRVGLVAKSDFRAAADVLVDIARWLEQRKIQPVFDAGTARLAEILNGTDTYTRDQLPLHVDLIVVLGGDGTLLGMADRIAKCSVDIPILGVNFGSLGFLTEVPLPELYPSLEATVSGQASVEERLMLRSQTIREGGVVSDALALNDVVIARGALSRIIDISVSVGDEFVARFKADGLIMTSPTGSTAYNLAAGGPIVHPSVDALVLTPIAPHTLTNRPVVIPASSEIRVQPLGNAQDEIFITFDGQSGFELRRDDLITVTRAKERLRLVRAASRSYFGVLRQKLKWAER